MVLLAAALWAAPHATAAEWVFVSLKHDARWTHTSVAPAPCSTPSGFGSSAGTAETHHYTGTLIGRGPGPRWGYLAEGDWSVWVTLDDGSCLHEPRSCRESSPGWPALVTGRTADIATHTMTKPRVRATSRGLRVTLPRSVIVGDAEICGGPGAGGLRDAAAMLGDVAVTIPWSRFGKATASFGGGGALPVVYASVDDRGTTTEFRGTVTWSARYVVRRSRGGFRPDFRSPP